MPEIQKQEPEQEPKKPKISNAKKALIVGAALSGAAPIYIGPKVADAIIEEVARQPLEAGEEAMESAKDFGFSYLGLVSEMSSAADIDDAMSETKGLLSDAVSLWQGQKPSESLLADMWTLKEDIRKIANGDLDDFEAVEQIMAHTERFVKRHPESDELQAKWTVTKAKFDFACKKYEQLKLFIKAASPDASLVDRVAPFDKAKIAESVWKSVREKISEDLDTWF